MGNKIIPLRIGSIGDPLQTDDARIPTTVIAAKIDVSGSGGSDCTDDGISYETPKIPIPYLGYPYDEIPFFPENE